MFFFFPSCQLRSLPQLPAALLFAGLLSCLISGCADKKSGLPPKKTPAAKAAAAKNVSAQVAAVPELPRKVDELAKKTEDEIDHGCSYFYFLWGQHAELEGKYDAALEAYEKALICDPNADIVISKLTPLLINMNRSEEAAARLKDYLEKQPDDAAARIQLAKLFFRDGKLHEAAEQYHKAHDLNPKDTTALLLLSELHLSEKKPDLAKDALKKVLAADNSSYPAHLLLARLLVAQEQVSQGLEHYRQALALSPSDSLKLEMAEVLIEQKKYSQAVKMCQEILAQDEMNEEARIALAHVYLLQKKEKKAMAEIKRLNELTNSPELVELTVVKLCIRWEEYSKAIALLQGILKKENLAEARYLLAVLQFQEKKYEEVLSVLEKITPEAKEYEDGLILQVRTLRELARQEQAAALLETALVGQKQLGPEIWVLLAGLYQTAEQDEICLKTFARALKAYPDDELLLYEYGLFLDYVGKKKQAAAAMQKLIKLNPNHAGALNYIGYTWAESKVNLSKAFLYLSRAKELKPENAYIQDSLGWLYCRLGKLDEALKTLEQAAKLAPDDAAIFDHLGEVHLASGRSEEALQAWRKAVELSAQHTIDGKKNKKQLEREEQERRRIEEKIERLEQKEKQ